MRRRLVIVLAFAALVGFVASFLVYRVVMTVQAGVKPDESEQIVVAAVNMGMAETITPKHVKVVPWPKTSVPSGAITSVANAEGRVVRSSIVAGEPLIEGKLAPQLAGKGGLMPMLVSEGQRAVTIRVDDAIRETGFILPNSKVDVLVSMAKPGAGSGEKIAKTILQDVLVLASGQVVELRDNKPVTMTTVTLSLDLNQTEKLTLAQTEGRLFLVTRSMADNRIVSTPGATKASLLADVSAPPAPRVTAAAPKARAVAAAPPSATPVLPAPTIETISVSVLRANKASEQRFVKKGADEWVEKGSEK